jgi:hypothetical protein
VTLVSRSQVQLLRQYKDGLVRIASTATTTSPMTTAGVEAGAVPRTLVDMPAARILVLEANSSGCVRSTGWNERVNEPKHVRMEASRRRSDRVTRLTGFDRPIGPT